MHAVAIMHSSVYMALKVTYQVTSTKKSPSSSHFHQVTHTQKMFCAIKFTPWKCLASPLVTWERNGSICFEEVTSTHDPFARARYLEKPKLLGLEKSGDSYNALGRIMTCMGMFYMHGYSYILPAMASLCMWCMVTTCPRAIRSLAIFES